MKKNLIKILSALAGALVFGVLGFLKFVSYGANDCDNPGKMCDCFCCHSFGLRGYEACGNYGLLVGAGLGLVIGYLAYLFIKRMSKLKIRNFLGNFYFIHFEVALGLFAFLGFLSTGLGILSFFALLSFAGAVCGAFIRVIDTIKASK